MELWLQWNRLARWLKRSQLLSVFQRQLGGCFLYQDSGQSLGVGSCLRLLTVSGVIGSTAGERCNAIEDLQSVPSVDLETLKMTIIIGGYGE